MLGFINLLLILYLFLVVLHILELVANVVATSSLAMFFPVAETGPAEVVLATQTDHVIAALVFLYRSLALRALFSIRHDPSEI